MFFRRHTPHQPTFEERLAALRAAGFQVAAGPGARARIARGGCAAIVSEGRIECAGWAFADDIGLLVDGGYQKFWAVNGRRRAPARAAQLEALHEFQEDLKEALGLESFYNTSLGTTNDLHQYDRLSGRE